MSSKFNVFFVLIILVLIGNSNSMHAFPHPFYVSITEIRVETYAKSITVSCRMFMDDLEDAISKLYEEKTDLIKSVEKQSHAEILSQYIRQHLQILSGGQFCLLQMVGYEIEDEAVWCHLTSDNISFDGAIHVTNRLLYDFISGQVNIIHVYINNQRQTSRLIYPDSKHTFSITN
ncbi:MAG: hypothetical protein IAE67_04160 [Candidatus Competibacteraceae bacterium]|nr:hypothetical protein [Candidatus Competibacteraceae bacterium]